MEDYFATLRSAREKVVIPDEFRRLDAAQTVSPASVERAFVEANQGLADAGVSSDCDKRYLREIRICLTKDLQFRACPELERRSCRAKSVVMPPVRGG
jgi:ribonuclease T2